MIQTSTVFPYEGETPNGPKFGNSYTSMCRFEYYKRKRTDSSGKEYYSTARLFLPITDENTNLELDSKIVVDGKTYILKEKQLMYGFSLSHIECVVM